MFRALLSFVLDTLTPTALRQYLPESFFSYPTAPPNPAILRIENENVSIDEDDEEAPNQERLNSQAWQEPENQQPVEKKVRFYHVEPSLCNLTKERPRPKPRARPSRHFHKARPVLDPNSSFVLQLQQSEEFIKR